MANIGSIILLCPVGANVFDVMLIVDDYVFQVTIKLMITKEL